MPAFAINRNPQRIRVRIENSRSNAHHPRRKRVADMQRHGHVRPGKARQQAVVDHALGAANRFLRRLADQHQRPVPGVFAVRHDRGRADDRCHVQVVSAGVHHRNIVSGVIFGVNLTRVRKPGLLFHRQRVQFRSKHHRRARAVLQDGHNPRASDVFRHLIAEASQPAGQLRRSLSFVRREFGVLMNIQIQRVRVRIDGFDFL